MDLIKGDISEGEGKAACTLSINDADCVNLLTGKLAPQSAFMQGKLKLSGNMAAAMKLNSLLSGRTLSVPEGAGAGDAPKAAGGDWKADKIFTEMGKRLSQDPSMVKKINGVYQWKITKDGKTRVWTVDLKNGAGSVGEGEKTAPDVTLTLSDDDYADMVLGKLNAQQAFMQGKIKIAGNMSYAMKLGQIMKPSSKL